MIPSHCRHRTYPKPGGAKLPTSCSAGVVYADVMLPAPGPIFDRLPCMAGGRKAGASCPHFAPWTAEEIEADRRELDRIMSAVEAGTCAECGATLLRRGTAFACPSGHVSGFACGADDIKEGPY